MRRAWIAAGVLALAACGGGGASAERIGEATTTEASTTEAPTTGAATTGAPTTGTPTSAPTTAVPPTTAAPTTAPPPPTTTAPPLPPPTSAPPLPADDAASACGPPVGTWRVTTFTTATFVVHICDSTSADGSTWYRGRNRENGDRIDLPAQYGDVGVYASNGEFQYYVNAEVLTVYRGDEQIFSEPVLSVT